MYAHYACSSTGNKDMDRLLGELEVSANEMLSPGASPSSEVPLQNTKK